MANILVVDDEIGIRELLSEILNDEGHLVHLAENAAQARSLRQAQELNLILLDIWMPDTDGVTLLKEWSASGQANVPVIMMSGHATIETAVDATRIGAMDFLEKPIALQKLLRAVQKGLERPRTLRSLMMTSNSLPLNLPKNFEASSPDRGRLVAPGNHEPASSLPELPLNLPLRNARDAFERAYFEYHLLQENGSMTGVAERTGLERTHLYRKLKQLGIELPRRSKK